jgi:TorA maturation chaperone TorD
MKTKAATQREAQREIPAETLSEVSRETPAEAPAEASREVLSQAPAEAPVAPSAELAEAIASCSQILGSLYLQDPKDEQAKPLLEQLAALDSLDDWPFGGEAERARAYELIHRGLAAPRLELAREYQRLFIGPHHFEAPAWGSVYLDRDQVLFGCSTLELRQWMRENGITMRTERREPEDHIGKMLLLLGWLAQEKPELVAPYLAEHLTTWAPRYLELLKQDAKSPFYEGLALLTEATLESITDELALHPIKRPLYR